MRYENPYIQPLGKAHKMIQGIIRPKGDNVGDLTKHEPGAFASCFEEQ